MKRILSILLLVAMLMSMLSFTAFASDEIIITSSDSLFKCEGEWAESSSEMVAGPTGGTSWYTFTKGDKATYDASGLKKGNYGVYLYMTPYATTADKIDITITASGKSKTLLVDGAHGGIGNRHWIYLGKYDFDGSKGDCVVQEINASAVFGCTRTSAVKFVKDDTNTAEIDVLSEESAPQKTETPSNNANEIIITSSDAKCKMNGTWAESTNEAVAGPLGGTSWYAADKDSTVKYDASDLNGNYGVYLYMTPLYTTADMVDVTITASGESVTYITDGLHGGQSNRHWLYLGNYDFDGSSDDGVMQKINAKATAGSMRTSGVKFVKDDKNTAKPDVISELKEDGSTSSSEPKEIVYTTIPEKGSITMGTNHPGFSKTGRWVDSSVVMPADGLGWYTATVGDYGMWYPYINKAENVEVFYFKPNATSTEDPGLQVEVFTEGETKKHIIDFTQPPTDWYSLGRYNFSGDGSEYIKITKVEAAGASRLTCLKFVIDDGNSAAKSVFYGTDLHIVERLGMLIGEGDGITAEYIKKVPTRVQAAIMVLRLNGVDKEAEAFTGTDNFTDAEKEAWAKPYLAYLKAHPEFGLVGTGDNMFEPTANIDEQAYAKILLTALGYEYNVDFTWDGTLAFAKEKGIAKAESGAFTVNDLAIMTASALNLNCKDGTPYLEKLVLARDGVADEGVFGTELPADLKAARDEAKNKKRGIIYNNDGNDVYHDYPEYPGTYDISHLDGTTINKDNFLKMRSYGLEDSQAATIFYCTGVFNSYHHESTGITDVRVRDWARALKEYTGKDSLETMIDYGHEIGREVFWSMRMNDHHDYSYEENQLDPWKQANLDLLMSRKAESAFLPYGGTYYGGFYSLADYTHMPVRQLVYDIFKDTLTRYDVDGIELDFRSFCVFFKETAQGIDLYPENTERMNNLIRMIRDLTEKVSIERGKPILVSIYVPDSLDFCKSLGLDIRKWMDEDLIDIVSVGTAIGAFQTWEDAIGEYKDYDVQIYAALDPLSMEGMTTTYEIDRNEAALAYAAGADGIYLYNYFNPDDERFNTFGSAETVGKADPNYVTKRLPYFSRVSYDAEKYVTIGK